MNNGQTKRSAPAGTPSASKVILLAEDTRDDVELFRRALQRSGLQNPLHVVRNGDEAINYLLGEGQYADRARFPMPHLLLLDSKMPGKSGCEVLKWVRERPELSAVAVIILGGSGSPNEEDTAYRLGALGYHIKPATTEELEHLVKRICGNW